MKEFHFNALNEYLSMSAHDPGSMEDYVFYNNGYDEGVSVFNDKGDLLFKFDEKISESQAVVLLKGYVTGITHN